MTISATPWRCCAAESKTSLSQFWPYAADRPGQIPDGAKDDAAQEQAFADYCDLMSQSQVLVAGDILDAYPVQRHHCLLDVGGGEGAFLAAAAARAPDLALRLFELPRVAERARAQFGARGLSSRAEVFSGSFLNDRCRKAPISSRLCVCCTTTMMKRRGSRWLPLMRPCRAEASFCWPSRWRKPLAPSRWATPISAFISSRWVAAVRGPPMRSARFCAAAGFVGVSPPEDPSSDLRQRRYWRVDRKILLTYKNVKLD